MRISRRRASSAALLAGALALPNVTSAIGVAFTPQLLEHAPLALLMLHPYIPIALLVLPETSVVVFVAVAVTFRLIPRYLAFRAGRLAGQEELERYLARRPTGRVSRLLHTSQRLIEPALVVVAGAPVSAAAGALGLGSLPFLAWSFIGALLPTLLLVVIGATAAEPVRWLSDAITERVEIWWGVLAVVAVASGIAYLLRRRRLSAPAGTIASEPRGEPEGRCGPRPGSPPEA